MPQTLSQLRDLQRLTARAIMRPLTRTYRSNKRWDKNRSTSQVVSQFIKPNDRLSSFERIAIYNRQYWFRLIDCLYEDYPGLFAVLGRAKFNGLIHAYLERCPSQSYSLRNLGSRLVDFIRKHPDLVTPKFDLAHDMARFEWAQAIAFDERANPAVTVDDLLGKNPAKIRLALQPYMTLLQLSYPLDDFVLALKQDNLRRDASNASEEDRTETAPKRTIPLPRRRQTFVAVHRFNNDLYYKRLTETSFNILTALADGKSVAAALNQAFATPPTADEIKEWFQTWTALGWFCRR